MLFADWSLVYIICQLGSITYKINKSQKRIHITAQLKNQIWENERNKKPISDPIVFESLDYNYLFAIQIGHKNKIWKRILSSFDEANRRYACQRKEKPASNVR